MLASEATGLRGCGGRAAQLRRRHQAESGTAGAHEPPQEQHRRGLGSVARAHDTRRRGWRHDATANVR